MLGFRYQKNSPTNYVIQFKGGKAVRQGAGLSLFYFAPTSTVVHVPLSSVDVPFLFEETTADFQDATLQGELTYRIRDPKLIAELLDYSVDPAGRHRTDDPTKLNDRLVQVAKTLSRAFVQRLTLNEALKQSDALADFLQEAFKTSEVVNMYGVEVLNIALQSIKATPEMAKALQASAREKLLQQADEAIYARRNVSVELEREIKENELKTQIAIENKQREVRETKLQADIALENQRTELVDQTIANETKENEARTAALRDVMDAVKDVDWKTLIATQGKMDSKQMIAMAFRDLADNAQKLGNVNITPDLLSVLLQAETDNDPSG